MLMVETVLHLVGLRSGLAGLWQILWLVLALRHGLAVGGHAPCILLNLTAAAAPGSAQHCACSRFGCMLCDLWLSRRVIEALQGSHKSGGMMLC